MFWAMIQTTIEIFFRQWINGGDQATLDWKTKFFG
jgi:hypothetical protein